MSNMPDKSNRPTPPQAPNRFSRSLVGWVLIVLMSLTLMYLIKGGDERRTVSISEFWSYVNNDKLVNNLNIKDDRIEGETKAGTPGVPQDKPNKFKVVYPVHGRGLNFDSEIRGALAKYPNPPQITYETESWWEGGMVANLLILVAGFFLIWFLVFRRLGGAPGGGGFLGNFGRSRHRVSNKESPRVTFNDVAGIDDAKDEVREIIEFLKNPKKFQRLGGRVPRGVLLVGEPGCGKTLMAKAIAGEAEVPFFSISGSDFVEMFVGVGASRVRDLFKQAKDSSPCIVFLDEIDAVGRRRVNDHTGSGNEMAQTLNAILVEMDGFDSSDQVIVIAATNRADVLDPALTRPGRFDRQVNVPLPDLEGRVRILKIYADKVTIGPDVDLHRLARGTPMFSGADLAALVNEAAIAATMANKECVEQADMEEARDKVRWGRARKSRVIDEKEKEITAFHEAGHAMVQMLTPGADPLHKVSIIPRGTMGGATFSLPEKDRYIYTRTYCQAFLRVCLGGRLSEEIFCHDISSGAAADIAQATELAKRMVLDWGMSEKLGLVRYSDDDRGMFIPGFGAKDYSDQTAQVIDQEIKALIDKALAETRELLMANQNELKALAEALLRYETLTADEVRKILDGASLDKPTVGDLLDRERARSTGPGVTISPPAVQPDDIPPIQG
jgi:cell division protease FtsH